jgi:hypothetical protein
VELDDIYDTFEYTDLTGDDLDAEVVAEARRITALLRGIGVVAQPRFPEPVTRRCPMASCARPA